jgi:hypothetical protein
VTSNTVTISGINAPAPISVVGGTYSINGGAFTSASGTILNGQTVAVRQTASTSYSTTTIATLTVGTLSRNFSVTTAAMDTTPAAFSFTSRTGILPGTIVTSNTITISGINAPSPISIAGGSYSISGGAFTSAAGTILNGQTVAVRQTASSAYSTTTVATLTIGGVNGTFSVTTAAMDVTPAGFSFTSRTGILPGTVVTSNTVTITGINAPAPISIVGGSYSINGGAFTSAAGTILNNQTVAVRQTASSSYSTTTVATLTVGTLSRNFSVTTAARDTTPASFSFTAVTGAPRSTLIVSNPITVSGINAPSPISITGGAYSIDGGAFTTAAGTVTNGQTVTVRLTSSANALTTTSATLTIGGVSGVFRVTTGQ